MDGSHFRFDDDSSDGSSDESSHISDVVKFELSKTELKAEHHGCVNKCVVFHERNECVTVGTDNSTMIFCLRTFNLLKELKFHSGAVDDVCRWDDDIFLTCSRDGLVAFHSISELETKRNVLPKKDASLYRLLKLNDSVFVTTDGDGWMFCMDFHGELMAEYKNDERIEYNTSLILSKKYPNCFFTNFERSSGIDEYYRIKMFSYENSRITFKKDFVKHKRADITSMASLLRGNEEYIIAFSNMRLGYVYSIDSGKIVQTIDHGEVSNASCVLNDRYILAGDHKGRIVMYYEPQQPQPQQQSSFSSSHNNDNFRDFELVFKNHEVHGSWINCIKMVNVDDDRRTIHFLSVSDDRKAFLIRVHFSEGFLIENKFDDVGHDPDLIDRLDFVKDEDCIENVMFVEERFISKIYVNSFALKIYKSILCSQ